MLDGCGAQNMTLPRRRLDTQGERNGRVHDYVIWKLGAALESQCVLALGRMKFDKLLYYVLYCTALYCCTVPHRTATPSLW